MPVHRLTLFAAPLFVLALAVAARGDEPSPLAKALVDKFEKEAAEIRKKAAEQINQRRQGLLAALQDLQDTLTKEGKKTEADAVRDQIERIKGEMVAAKPDPGNMEAYRDKVGKSFFFEVTGSADGTIYGTDVYTSDSALAKAAVHAGVLKVGKKGIVKVTMVPVAPNYTGSSRNGVDSSDWPDPWFGAYKIEAAKE
jgi:hypothetical protein